MRRTETLRLVLVLCVAGIAALQPVSSDDLWWQLSRGRQVLLGSLQPSAELLTLETNGEADWFGGVPAYLLHATLGAGGLMLARLAAVTYLALRFFGFRRFLKQPKQAEHRARGWWALLTGSLALLAISPALDPLPVLFDVIAVAILWSRVNGQRHTLGLGLLFLAWSNLSTGVSLGAALLLLSALTSTLIGRPGEARSRWRDLLVAVAAGSLNPRGVWAWVDSARMLLPAATVSPAVLEQTPWTPLPMAAWEFPEYALFILTLLWLGRCAWTGRGEIADSRRAQLEQEVQPAQKIRPAEEVHPPRGGRRSRALQFLLVQLLAWLSAANVPLAIAWLACDLVGRWRLPTDAPRFAEESRLRSTVWGPVAIAAGLVMAVLFSGRLDSIGWGIEAKLDYRLLEIALAETDPHGTAFADDVRSGGMLVWTLPPSGSERPSGEDDPLRLQDIPSRALAGGRLAEHQQLLVDLRAGRQTRYWRDDRSPGGFWLALQFRNTSLVCISSDDFGLVRGLEPTIWKPLSLDSPVIPYARAGDPAYAEQLLAVLRYRQLVDLEPWNYVVPPSSGSAFDRDLFGLRESAGSEATVLRQARTFRAMKLHYAALRVLFVGRERWPENSQLKEEVRRCQAELAHQERRVAGQASWLRDWAAQSSDPAEIEPRDPPPRGRPKRSNQTASNAEPEHAEAEETQARAALLRGIEVYLSAGPQAALERARRSGRGESGQPPTPGAANIPRHPQLAYAWLCWAVESGQHDFASELARSLTTRSLPPNLRLLVQYRMEDLGLLSEDSDEDSEQ